MSGGAGRKTGALIRNTMEIRRASKKAGVHRKKQKLLSDTRKTRSSLGKVGGIEGNTRKKGRTEKVVEPKCEEESYKMEQKLGRHYRIIDILKDMYTLWVIRFHVNSCGRY